jgi:hypothetical protein
MQATAADFAQRTHHQPPLPWRAYRRGHGAAHHATSQKRTDGRGHHRQGGRPSRDWFNAELGFFIAHRASQSAWFNALEMAQTVAKGREAVEKLPREGKTGYEV